MAISVRHNSLHVLNPTATIHHGMDNGNPMFTK